MVIRTPANSRSSGALRSSSQRVPSSSSRKAVRTLTRTSQQIVGAVASRSATWLQHRFKPFEPLVQTRKFRLILSWCLVVASLGGLGFRLMHLQLFQAEVLKERAEGQQTYSLRPFVPRRPIADSQGNILAMDQTVYTLYAHPILFNKSKTDVATELSGLIGIPAPDLLKRFNAQDSGIEIKQQLSINTARRVRQLGQDGLELVEHQERFYPQGDLFGGIVGYVNSDREGQAGLELSHQEQLERPARAVKIRRMGDGSVIPVNLPPNFLHQDELRLQLTLDSRLQRAARTALKAQLEEFSAKRGTAIVMDSKDGRILALESYPSFDPNRFYEFDVSLFRNWAVSDLYEPGSTFKPINVAIALEDGVLKPNDYIFDEGQIQIEDRIIQNNDFTSTGGRGSLSLAEVMQYSSNIAMIHIIERLKGDRYYDWLEKLGIGKTLDTDLPGAPGSQLKDRKEFLQSRLEPAVTSFGQGFSLTALQLVQLHGALANGGQLVTPHIVEGLFDSKGKLQWQPDLPKNRRVFSPQNTQAVVQMMESVIDHGTGKSAAIEGYRIGGKTGTAQKAENGVYIAGARITSFVAILPVEDPRYVVAVVVDEPKGENAYGSTVSAPVVREISKALIQVLGLPPAKPITPDNTSDPTPRPD